MQTTIWGTSGKCPECGERQLNNAVRVCSCNEPEHDEDCDAEIHYPTCSCGYAGRYA